ncbi:MAG: hypothetical protein ACT4P6_19430 [Gemmatimonadaceae bacterium]
MNADTREAETGDRALFKIGGAMGVSGSLIAFVGNALHPRSTAYYGDPVAWLNHNTPSAIWFPSHVMILLGMVLLVGEFVAISRSLSGDRGHGVGTVALAHALIGSSLILVTLALDGLVVPKLSEAWRIDAVPSPDAVLASSIFYHTIFNLFYLFQITLFGLSPLLFGVAMLLGKTHARWVGWAAVFVGGSVVITAIPSMLGVATEFLDAVVWTVTASLVSLWWLVTGVLLWRRASASKA